jgi:ribonuclease HI
METIIVYTDGGARGNPGPAGIGIYITDATGTMISEYAQAIGNATNNFAEYQAVATALNVLKKTYGKLTKDIQFTFRLDSELVQKQLSGEYQIKDAGLVPLFIEIHNLRVSAFPHLTFSHVPRAQNKDADRLVNEALDAAGA